MKNGKILYNLIFFLALLLFPGQPARSQSNADSIKFRAIGYVDANRDGMNDLFRDANGDGKNDVTNDPYPHSFKFEDKNKDGLNDLWLDKDGDGVNDLIVARLKQKGIRPKISWIDKDGDGILDADVQPRFEADLTQFVLDSNQDGKNDVTGLEFKRDNCLGYRYGCIDEEMNKQIKKFIDKNGDGMYDHFASRLMRDMGQQGGKRPHDYFIDRDGDGIADDRGFGTMRKDRARHQRGKKGKQ